MVWTGRRIETTFIKAMTDKNRSAITCSKTQERLGMELNLSALRMNDALLGHIKNCPECTKVWSENLRVKKALHCSVKRETAPDSLREKIQAMFAGKNEN